MGLFQTLQPASKQSSLLHNAASDYESDLYDMQKKCLIAMSVYLLALSYIHATKCSNMCIALSSIVACNSATQHYISNHCLQMECCMVCMQLHVATMLKIDSPWIITCCSSHTSPLTNCFCPIHQHHNYTILHVWTLFGIEDYSKAWEGILCIQQWHRSQAIGYL